jgi:hypothetical protein
VARTKKEAFISKVETASFGASSGAAIGSLFGGVGAPVGAAVGGVAGLIFGDVPIVFQEPMIIIPAREQYLLGGNTPSYMVYAHAGESLIPTGGNIGDTALGVAEVEALLPVEAPKKKRTNKYTRFNKKFNFRAKKKSESGMAYMKARNKAVSAAWRKQ